MTSSVAEKKSRIEQAVEADRAAITDDNPLNRNMTFSRALQIIKQGERKPRKAPAAPASDAQE